MKLNKQNHYLFFYLLASCYAALFYNRSGQAKPLKTDEADKVFNVTENKINSIIDIFFLKYYLDLWLLQGDFF